MDRAKSSKSKTFSFRKNYSILTNFLKSSLTLTDNHKQPNHNGVSAIALSVVVWLKIRINDIQDRLSTNPLCVVVWLKIRKNDITYSFIRYEDYVMVWLKIRINDILSVEWLL